MQPAYARPRSENVGYYRIELVARLGASFPLQFAARRHSDEGSDQHGVRGCEGTGDEVDGVTAAETVHAQKRPEGAEQAQVVFGVSFDDSGDNVGEVGLGVAGRSGGQ